MKFVNHIKYLFTIAAAITVGMVQAIPYPVYVFNGSDKSICGDFTAGSCHGWGVRHLNTVPSGWFNSGPNIPKEISTNQNLNLDTDCGWYLAVGRYDDNGHGSCSNLTNKYVIGKDVEPRFENQAALIIAFDGQQILTEQAAYDYMKQWFATHKKS